MEFKSIEQIIKEHAIECSNTFGSKIVAMDIQAVTVVCERYAQQFQSTTDVLTTEIMVLRERTAEMLEMLEESKSVIEWYMENTKPDHDWQTFFNIGANQIEQIEQLITKAK